MSIKTIAIALTVVAAGLSADISAAGKKYPTWKEGELEIHHIYTGRGEANYLIFPDGTSMLIDSGDYTTNDWNMTPALPDTTRRAGEWVARYIRRVNPADRNVDYLMISHFHNDHTGDFANLEGQMTLGRDPDYELIGIAQTGEQIIFGKEFDRGYPTYYYPLPLKEDKGIDSMEDLQNLKAFLDWQRRKYGLKQERFKVGKLNQIKLNRNPEKYAGVFSIRNLASAGEVWTGEGEYTVRYYDLHEGNLRGQNENTKSLAIRINYGPFSYYTGGDVCSWLYDEEGNRVDIEEQVGKACGHVDVCKANHHAHRSAMSDGFVNAVKATNYVLPMWDYWHFQPTVIKRLVASGCNPGEPYNIFPQYIHDRIWDNYSDQDWVKAACPVSGHVVVKVYDNGKKYKIFIVSAEDESMTVKKVYGPFDSGK